MDLIIYKSYTEPLINEKQFSQLLLDLPPSLQRKARRYQSEMAAYNFVVGRLLLRRGLIHFGVDSDLEKIEIQKNGKPIIGGLHFNISHSSHQVICGFSKGGRLGIDLEKIGPLELENFETMFSKQEWEIIHGAKDSLRSFYWFWTRKESIIKALGRNLDYLHQIELDVTLDHFMADGKKWFLRDLNVGEGYIGAVCTEEEFKQFEMIEILQGQ